MQVEREFLKILVANGRVGYKMIAFKLE